MCYGLTVLIDLWTQWWTPMAVSVMLVVWRQIIEMTVTQQTSKGNHGGGRSRSRSLILFLGYVWVHGRDVTTNGAGLA